MVEISQDWSIKHHGISFSLVIVMVYFCSVIIINNGIYLGYAGSMGAIANEFEH